MKNIKVHNNINKIEFTNLSEKELNILFYIFYILQNKERFTATISFGEIKENANIKHISNKRLYNYLKNILSNLSEFKFIETRVDIDTGEEVYIKQVLLFQKFEIDKDNKKVITAVNSEGVFLLNNLTKNFTKLNLLTYITLNGKYSKELYRRLVQFKNTGFYRVKMIEFRDLYSVPKSYQNSNVKRKIIEPAVKELKEIFPNLEYNFFYEKIDGKMGRPSIKTIEFSGIENEKLLLEGYKEINYNRREWEIEKKTNEITKYLNSLTEEERKNILVSINNKC